MTDHKEQSSSAPVSTKRDQPKRKKLTDDICPKCDSKDIANNCGETANENPLCCCDCGFEFEPYNNNMKKWYQND